MNRNILKLINGFNSLQNDRDGIKEELEKELKAQKMCATQLKNLEKKLTEKMERRDVMLAKYIDDLKVELENLIASFVVESDYSANFECNLFGNNYVLFKGNMLSTEAVESGEILLKEMANLMVKVRINMANPYNECANKLIILDNEIKKNPKLAKEKLVAREVKKREDAINENIEKIKEEIAQDEELLQYYNSKLEGKPSVKDNLINRIIKRKQLKAQEMASKLTNGIAISYAKIDGLTEELEDKEELKTVAKAYVEEQLEILKDHIEILNYLDVIKGKLEAYNRRYVAPVQEQIKQTKNAIKSSETMITIHKATVNGNSEEIDDFLIGMYQDKSLVDKLLSLTKNECTPEQWKTITIIKQHYNEYVAKNLDNLLV